MTEEKLLELFFTKPSFFRNIRKCKVMMKSTWKWRHHSKYGLQMYNSCCHYWDNSSWKEFNRKFKEYKIYEERAREEYLKDNNVSCMDWAFATKRIKIEEILNEETKKNKS